MPISSKREWLQGPYQKAIERTPERAKVFETTGKMPIEPVYTQDDLGGFDPTRELGFPGDYPFTREGDAYRGFAIAGEDRSFHPAQARRGKEPATLEVWSDHVAKPAAVS